ncbi:MAG: Gfo/Idh/MocA family oxidoreductase [Elusimicrobiales bacterium]
MKKIRFGVIGAGKIGSYHARTLAGIEKAELVGVADVDLLRAQSVAWGNNAVAYRDYKDLLGLVDAVVVAVPTHLHKEISEVAIEKGIHCLVEKPITDSLEDAKYLAQLSEKKGVILQVGHVERFNPAVIEAAKYVKKPLYINMERLGPYDPRVSGIGVTLDLMIHDLDILLWLVNSEVESIDSIGASIFSRFEDISNARIRFKNGTVADVTASRITFEKIRRMRIYQDEEYISVDYISSRIKIYKKAVPEPKSLSDIEIITPKIEKRLPITEELKHFIECIENARKPLTDVYKGTTALKLAIGVCENMKLYRMPKGSLHNTSKDGRVKDIIEAAKGIIETRIDEGIGR